MVKKALIILCLSLCFSIEATANPMVHQEGSRIVDGSGQPLKLRGFLLEGWLMTNGTLWGAGLTSETKIAEKLHDLVGPEEAQRFREQIYQNFITERDIEMISQMGLNVIRVPFNHTILEDDARPFQYKESGWKILDRLLSWCEKHRVYVVLDLHSAPGGQSGVFVNDPDGSGLYNSEENIKRTIKLWKAIASRYKDQKIIAGYDLLNEPQIPWFTPVEKFIDVYVRIIKAIREVDSNHMVILSGAGFTANDLSMFDKVIDNNQALTFHTYNLLGSSIGEKEHRQFTDVSKKLNVPIWNGEIGAHTAEWVEAVIDMFEDPSYNISGWVFWPWKRVPESGKRYRVLMGIKSSAKWDLVRNWVAGAFGLPPKPSREDALEGMREFIEMMKADNLTVDLEMQKIITGFKQANSSTNNSANGNVRSFSLAEPIILESGVYNPWTDRCSDSAAPVRRGMYIRKPAKPGKYPVFLFLIGTLRTHNSETARGIVDRAAQRGFVAAAVDYDTIATDFHSKGPCDSMEAKSKCSLTVDDSSAPEAALNLICNGLRIDGSNAGLSADCNQGIVVSGFSQGALLAMLARNHDERIQAVWAIGHHNQALPDSEPLQCVHGKNGMPPDTRALAAERLRVLVGEGDWMVRKPHQQHLEAVTGRKCAPGTLGPCFGEDGSGWAIVPNIECGGKCKHEYLDNARFWDPSTWWGVDQNLDWLKQFVSIP